MSIISKMMRIAGRNPDGIAKAIKTDKEGNLNVSVGSDISYHLKTWTEIINPGEVGEVNLLDIKEPVVIDYLTYYTNNADTYARITPYDKNGNVVSALRIGDIGGPLNPGIVHLTPKNIITHSIGFAEVLIYNERENNYKIQYTDLKFPHGVRIDLHRVDGETASNISANALARTI